MKLTITPVGRCSKSNHQQYRTQTEALQVANAYKGSVSFDVYQCQHCCYWELKKKQEETTEVTNFLEEQTNPIEEAIKLLSDNGYWVIEPHNVKLAHTVLASFKKLREDLGLDYTKKNEAQEDTMNVINKIFGDK